MSMMSGIAAGALAGVAGALLMSAMRAGEKRAGLIADTPPEEVQDWLEERTGTENQVTPGEERALSEVWHVGYGAGLGALYGALRSELDFDPLPAGMLYGLGVYAISLGALGPALGITDPPWDESPRVTTPARIVEHLIFGAVTAVLTEQILDRTGSKTWQIA